MSRQIDTVNFDLLNGRPAALKPRVEVWYVEGQPGPGAFNVGNGNGEFVLNGIKYIYNNGSLSGNTSAAETFIDNCVNLVGTVVNVVDCLNTTFEKCLIVTVDDNNPKAKVRHAYLGDNGAIRVELNFQCVRVA